MNLKPYKSYSPVFSFLKKSRKHSQLMLAGLLFAVCCISCRPSPQFQETFTLPSNSWDLGYKPVFKINIDDTDAAYQIFLLIRHTDAYPFSNIWIGMDSQSPGDSSWAHSRVEVPLAAPSGQWLGRCAGELWEQRVPITTPDKPAFFPKKGKYTLRLQHEMRRNPLPEILTIGLRVEKLPPFHKE
jgi:gliding motility-associated lipoprotein GldH